MRALAVQPDSIAANKGLAKMYMRMGRTELAKTYFGRVLLLNPDDKRALECMEEITGDYRDIPKIWLAGCNGTDRVGKNAKIRGRFDLSLLMQEMLIQFGWIF
ncbi:MAG TPA: tetratricopeptide repeat protein [Terracidiphilus sp.]